MSRGSPSHNASQESPKRRALYSVASTEPLDDHHRDTANDNLAGAQYIAAVMGDFSREFSDLAHEGANITQALRLWHESGLSSHDFVTQLLYETRARTRRAQCAQGAGQVGNKMAYFFSVLRDLLTRADS